MSRMLEMPARRTLVLSLAHHTRNDCLKLTFKARS